jgi:hypothetical protein
VTEDILRFDKKFLYHKNKRLLLENIEAISLKTDYLNMIMFTGIFGFLSMSFIRFFALEPMKLAADITNPIWIILFLVFLFLGNFLSKFFVKKTYIMTIKFFDKSTISLNYTDVEKAEQIAHSIKSIIWTPGFN